MNEDNIVIPPSKVRALLKSLIDMPKKKPALLQAATYGMSGSFLLWKRYALSPAELCS
jgi:hypothetical protein